MFLGIFIQNRFKVASAMNHSHHSSINMGGKGKGLIRDGRHKMLLWRGFTLFFYLNTGR